MHTIKTLELHTAGMFSYTIMWIVVFDAFSVSLQFQTSHIDSDHDYIRVSLVDPVRTDYVLVSQGFSMQDKNLKVCYGMHVVASQFCSCNNWTSNSVQCPISGQTEARQLICQCPISGQTEATTGLQGVFCPA